MKSIMLVFVIAVVAFAANAQEKNKAEVVKFDRLESLLSEKGDGLRVINFWATWCAPCIKELPYFESLPENKNGRKLNVTLVSLDFADKLDKVNSFIDRKNIKSEVLLLDNIDYNSWIDKVDKNWSGAIPATVIVDTKTGKSKLHEGELTQSELDNLINEFIKS